MSAGSRVIDINLTGVFATVRAAARHMRPRGFGRIVVTTSLAATKVEPAIGAAYGTAKAGARHFMHSVALEFAADDITVNAIAPGFFVTNIGGGHAHDPEAAGGAREGHSLCIAWAGRTTSRRSRSFSRFRRRDTSPVRRS